MKYWDPVIDIVSGLVRFSALSTDELKALSLIIIPAAQLCAVSPELGYEVSALSMPKSMTRGFATILLYL